MKTSERIFRMFIAIMFVMMNISSSRAQMKNVAQSGMQFLKIAVDARMAGKGEAGIASQNDVSAIFWNPAGLALMDGKQIMVSYNNWIADITQNAIALGWNMGQYGSVAMSFVYMDYGEFYPTVRDPDDNSLFIDSGFMEPGEARSRDIYLNRNLNPIDLAAGVGYAKRFTDRFWMGCQFKIVHEDLGTNLIQKMDARGNLIGEQKVVDNKITNLAFDFGTVYKPYYRGISFAMSFQNFSREMKYQLEEFPMPVTFKIGLSVNLQDAIYNRETNSFHNIILNFDTVKPNDYSQRLNLGMEYSYREILYLRSGYKWNYDLESFTLGFGVKKNIGRTAWIIDGSYTQTDSFNSPLRFTLMGRF